MLKTLLLLEEKLQPLPEPADEIQGVSETKDQIEEAMVPFFGW